MSSGPSRENELTDKARGMRKEEIDPGGSLAWVCFSIAFEMEDK